MSRKRTNANAPKRKAEERQAQFTRRIQEVIGHDDIAKDVRIDKENKKVRTSAGDLPISPVMDPVWMDVRTRYRTPKTRPKSTHRPPPSSSSGRAPKKHKYIIKMGWDEKKQDNTKYIIVNKKPNGGRFRVKVQQNPYVHALASPIRFCPVTGASLPKFFLQNFKAVTNPDTKGHWFMPGDVEVSWTHKQAMEDVCGELDDVEDGVEKHDDVEDGSREHAEEKPKELDDEKNGLEKAFREEAEAKKSDDADDKFEKRFEKTAGSMKPEEEAVGSKEQSEEEPQNPITPEDNFEKHFEKEVGSEKHNTKEKSRSPAMSKRRPSRTEPLEDSLARQKETDQLLIESPSAYVVLRKPVIDSMAGKRGKTPFGDGWRTLLGRNQKVMNSDIPKRLVWREDMGDFVLDNLRKNVMKNIAYSVEMDNQKRSYIEPLERWEDVHESEKRGCLLWYDRAKVPTEESQWDEWMKEGQIKPFATYDVPDAKYEKSLPIYDIGRLMGPDYLAKLRKMPLFRTKSLFVVKKKPSTPLQLYLWKLQAYMAEYPSAEKVAEESAEKRRLARKRREEERQEELVQEQFRLEEEAREGYLRAKAERARMIQERFAREMRGDDEPKDKVPEAEVELEAEFGTASTATPKGSAAVTTRGAFATQFMSTARVSAPNAWGSVAIKPIGTTRIDRKSEVPKRPTIKAKAEFTPKRSAKAPAAPMTAADFTAQLTATPQVGSGSDSWGSSAANPIAPAKAINRTDSASPPSTKAEGEATLKHAGTIAAPTSKVDAQETAESKARATEPKVKPVKPRW
ncbi:hypothetical protein SGCOL_007122 [Colletotrichum sp. CLE4]